VGYEGIITGKEKGRSTKEKKERPTAMKTEQTYNYLYNVAAAAADDDDDDNFCQ
jgi:hypothetical protein